MTPNSSVVPENEWENQQDLKMLEMVVIVVEANERNSNLEKF